MTARTFIQHVLTDNVYSYFVLVGKNQATVTIYVKNGAE